MMSTWEMKIDFFFSELLELGIWGFVYPSLSAIVNIKNVCVHDAGWLTCERQSCFPHFTIAPACLYV